MLNDNDLLDLLLVSSGVLFVTTVTFAILWIRARERALRLRLARSSSESITDEITHVVHAVDAIAIEVERISDAQRFTVQAVAERLELPLAPKRASERVITPH